MTELTELYICPRCRQQNSRTPCQFCEPRETKTETVCIRVTPEAKNRWRRLAHRAGLTLSKWIIKQLEK